MSDSQRPHGLQPTRLLLFQARVLEWGAIALRTGKGLLKYMKIPESQNLEIKSRTQNYMEATIPQKYFHISR